MIIAFLFYSITGMVLCMLDGCSVCMVNVVLPAVEQLVQQACNAYIVRFQDCTYVVGGILDRVSALEAAQQITG